MHKASCELITQDHMITIGNHFLDNIEDITEIQRQIAIVSKTISRQSCSCSLCQNSKQAVL